MVIYQVADQFFGPKIEISNNVSLVYPQTANMKVWPWLANQTGSLFVSPLQDRSYELLTSHIKENFIFPQNTFFYPEASGSSLDIKNELSIQLNSIAGSVSNLKQSGIIQIQTEETVQNIISSSIKLVEISKDPIGLDSILINEYLDLMDRILPELNDSSTLYFDISKTTIDDILKNHEVILSYIQSKLDESGKVQISKTQNKLKQFLENENLLPRFLSMNEITEVGQRQYYNFWVNSAGRYELLMTESIAKNAYVNDLAKVDFQINDKRQTLFGEIQGNLISFGMIDLQKGLNEISLTNPPSINLISSFDNLIKIGNVKLLDSVIKMAVSQGNPDMIESPLGQTSGGDLYQISFEAQIPLGTSLYIQVIQDSDSEENGQKVPRVSIPITPNETDSVWIPYNIKLPALSLMTREAKIRLIAIMPNSQRLDGMKSILVRNLRVVRILDNAIFLRNYNLNKAKEASYSGQIINFTKISPVQYEGRVKLDKAGFILFKESYHPEWKLQLIKGNQVFEPKGHYLGYLYGNAWYIDEQPGDYNFSISFKPQQTVYLGVLLSGLGLLSIGVYVLVKKIRTR